MCVPKTTNRIHTLIYAIAFAMLLTVLFDLKRIAALGAIFYLIMDIGVRWGILRHLRSRIQVRAGIIVTALVLDVVVLSIFVSVKASSDSLILIVSVVSITAIVVGERLFMRTHTDSQGNMDM